MEKMNYELKELSLRELKETNGGNPWVIFIAGAIVGGMIYDVYKTLCKAAVEVQINHPEYYDGAVHSIR